METPRNRPIQLVKRIGGKLTGARADEVVDLDELVVETLGEQAQDGNSGALAFAYLWRRFGPPIHGGDDDKDLAAYILTTRDSNVFLAVRLPASNLAGCGYLVTERLRAELEAPEREWVKRFRAWLAEHHPECTDMPSYALGDEIWDAADAVVGERPDIDQVVAERVRAALRHCLLDLLRPVRVRDAEMTILGRSDRPGDPSPRGRRVKASKYAGWGVPTGEMDEMIAQGIPF